MSKKNNSVDVLMRVPISIMQKTKATMKDAVPATSAQKSLKMITKVSIVDKLNSSHLL